MEDALFAFHNITMDILKLFEKVMESEEVKCIPLVDVFTVICCVVDAISTGECFYKDDFE